MKTIWIMNHYATDTFFDRGGRHYYFAKYLIKKGYDVTIFCASTVHNTDKNIDTGEKKYKEDTVDGIPYVFVKTPSYQGNGISRIKNMISFYIQLFPVTKKFIKKNKRPDIILASSVHPLTLLAGIWIGKRLQVPCVCELRDLWPEAIVKFSNLSKKNLIIQFLYRMEKWIYKKADALIFTMAGGKQYIKEQGWTKDITPQKIYYINNGVDLDTFEYNKEHFQICEKDLDNEKIFKVLYAGSIRKVNNLGMIVECARELEKKEPKIKFLIWGDGDEREELKRKCKELQLNNIIFKGKVEKKYIPYILSKADINLLHWQKTDLNRYGCSLNKLFEYLAAKRIIVSDVKMGYDLLEEYQCGIVTEKQNEEELQKAILKCFFMTEEERSVYLSNMQKCIENYDFKVLTDKLEKILKDTERRK
ncbi:glycosyltransferase family 4 protein [Acetivibrio ethanolgignens]|uniref:Glycosyltransferase WbuB n=1 Tax=Acetivibrio ethanolgignens TaxID=290052 RepID=A0A0V8QEZ5_9FIRM|nr:glycosyltransferase family 4 protein [Acetivibrio ethanolgignens]KSV58806.1 hypothetical protein ASU35_11515 [Acetivibrio ethanolgignens]